MSMAMGSADAQKTPSDVKFYNPRIIAGDGSYHHSANVMVELNWSTEYETGKSYFEVQRSFDGSSFSTIALVLDGYKESNNTTSCKMRDGLVTLRGKDKAYYRLKKIEPNGECTYSNVVSIELNKTASNIAAAGNSVENK